MATRTSSKGRKIVKPTNFSTDSEVELQQTALSQMRDSRFLFYYGKNAFSTALNSSSWPQGTSWKHKLSLELGQAYPMIHNEPQPECIYLGKGSRTEISRHKLVILAQLKKGEPPSFVPETLLRDNRDEEVNSEDCETPLHSPLTQHVSQAAGSTSLIDNYNATKTAEIESAKNKSSSCEQFQLFFAEHQSRMARAESSFHKIKKQSDRRKRKLVNEFNDSVVSVCSFLKLMSRQNKNLRQSLLLCSKN